MWILCPLRAANLMEEEPHPVCLERSPGVMGEFSSCSVELAITHKCHSPLVQGCKHGLCPLGASSLMEESWPLPQGDAGLGLTFSLRKDSCMIEQAHLPLYPRNPMY